MPELYEPEHLDYDIGNVGPGLAKILIVALASALENARLELAREI